MSSIAWTGCTSRAEEARNASLSAASSSSVVIRSLASVTANSARRVIESRMRSSSGGV